MHCNCSCWKDREMADALSALKFLRALPYVDATDVAAVGHSFGGSLTVLQAEREPKLRAVVVFLRSRLQLRSLVRNYERGSSPPSTTWRHRSSSFTPRTTTPSRPGRCWTPVAS